MPSLRDFQRDERAAFNWFTVLQIALLLLVPAALGVFWWLYLRRMQGDEYAKYGPWGAPNKQGATAVATGDMKRQCNKCGLTVRPPKSSGPPICPNCMSVL